MPCCKQTLNVYTVTLDVVAPRRESSSLPEKALTNGITTSVDTQI